MSGTGSGSRSGAARRASRDALVELDGVAIDYVRGGEAKRAVDGVSLALAPGEALALVGESGCGKSTTAAALLGLLAPGGRLSAGAIRWRGRDLSGDDAEMRRLWRASQIGWLPQEPSAALDPCYAVGDQVAELLRVHRGIARVPARRRATTLLHEVGFDDAVRCAAAQPHELSGGQRQRVALAMALACEPALLIADEPTSALDAAVARQLLDLIDAQRRARGLALLLISHDLALVAARCDRVAVMYAGRIVEEGDAKALLDAPLHPYAQALRSARPPPRPLAPGERLAAIAGQPPPPGQWPKGCRFHPRCPIAVDACRRDVPPLSARADGRAVACPLATEAPR
jgi:oligopeptide/dipeptide ABC transporter ATP-binding protein